MDRPFHTSDIDLVSLHNGELSADSAKRLRGHLAYCADCRTRLNQFERAFSVYSDFQENVIKNAAPTIQGTWSAIQDRVGVISRPTLLSRGALLLAAAAVLCFTIGLVLTRTHLSKLAGISELLQKSAAIEVPVNRGLVLSTRGHRWLRPAVLDGSGGWHPATEEPNYERVKALFVQATYNWSDPLSARSFATWRDRLSQKRDSVTEIRDQSGRPKYYRVRTETSQNVLHRASLTLNAHTLRAVNGAFDFTSGENVELTEAPTAAPAVEVSSDPAKSKAAEVHPQQTESRPTPEDELRILAALDAIGADAGEPITVERKPDRIVVSGFGLSAERAREIEQALSDIPKTEVKLNDSQLRRSARAPVRVQQAAADPTNSALRDFFEQRAGGAEPLQQIVDQALDTSSAALAQAHALSALAKEFPRDIERNFGPEDRETLYRLVTNHARALAQDSDQLLKHLLPLLGTTTANGSSDTSAVVWQEGAITLLGKMEKLDRRINEALAGGSPPGSPDDLIHELRQSIIEISHLATAEAAGAHR